MWWVGESVEGGRRRFTNTQRGGNLGEDAAYSDFKLHVEFRYPKEGNSGVYFGVAATRLRSRTRRDQREREATAASARSTDPDSQPECAKGAGEWQTYDITLAAGW